MVNTTTAHNGSDVIYQRGNEVIAVTKNSQSVRVIVLSDLCVYARKATYIVITPETPIGQAPAPALSASCARKTTNVVEPQITQEKTCGFVLACVIESIYGKNAMKVSAIAVVLRSSLYTATFNRSSCAITIMAGYTCAGYFLQGPVRIVYFTFCSKL